MNIEQSIEFSRVKEAVKGFCHTQAAKQMVDDLHWLEDAKQIKELLCQSYQMKMILLGLTPFVDSGYIDMRAKIKALKIQGACLNQEDLAPIVDSLKTIKEIFIFLNNKHTEEVNHIFSLSDGASLDEEVLLFLEKIVDVDGSIKDSCSEKLRKIRKDKASLLNQIDKQIQATLLLSKQEGWSEMEDEIAIRNNHLTIPVKASYKKYLKGILHDCSSTGQTFYIEPQKVVELNFSLKELDFLMQEEIHKILVQVSDFLRLRLDNLIKCYDFLVQIDFLKAKAKYAIKHSCTMPEVEDKPFIQWYAARHPLLEDTLKKKNKEIVPMNILLNEQQRIIVISGPNAGGKSICLKTIALLQYMLQCGLLISLKQTSQAGVFKKIFLSIGDEQSLEDDLSTYSSHLLNMKEICEKSDDKTLFLIDEFASGTDPQIGGAIAESVLEYLDDTLSYGVVTTHYSILKNLAFQRPSIVNAAMLFDTKQMKPLYKLSIGNPGSSFALELAQKIGLRPTIINKAKQKIGNQALSFENQLQKLQQDKLAIEQKLKDIQLYDDMLHQTYQKYDALLSQLKDDKNQIIKNANLMAKDILQGANKQIEHAIENIKTSNADKQVVKQEKQELEKKLKQIETQNQELEKEQNTNQQNIETMPIINGPIELNDYVIFPDSQVVGQVVQKKKNDYIINVGDINIKTKGSMIAKISKQTFNKQQKKNNPSLQVSSSIMDKVNYQRQHFDYKLDIRGLRVDEALKKVESFIDQACLIRERTIRILHGTGNGILKTAIRDYLRKQSLVKTFYSEDIRFGGEGITIVELNF